YYLFNKKYSLNVLLIVFSVILSLLISLINNNITLIEFVANRVIQLLSFTFLTDIYMKKNPEIYISILSKLFSFYIILNFLSIIIFPNGLWLDHKFRPAYILGIGNSMAYM